MNKEREMFIEAINYFASKYPSRGLQLVERPYGEIVYMYGDEQFNSTGFNYLYNMTRLCELLKDELR